MSDAALDLSGVEAALQWLEGGGRHPEHAQRMLARLEADGGLDRYADEVQKDLEGAREAALAAYFSECQAGQGLQHFHSELSACDSALAELEATLESFAADLTEIGSSVRQLQQQAKESSERLASRVRIQQQLTEHLESVMVTPQLVKRVFEADLAAPAADNAFKPALAELERKLAYVREAREAPGGAPVSVEESLPDLERLRAKAVARVYEFLGTQLTQLRKPKTNIQILQRNVLIKSAEYVKFLRTEEPAKFDELWKKQYAPILASLYLDRFKAYAASLQKHLIESDSRGKVSLLIEPPEAGLFAFGRERRADQGNVFSLNGREKVLGRVEADPIVPHNVAVEDQGRLYYEQIFRSHQKLLVDTASSEYLFVCDFFGVKDDPELADEIFQAVLGGSLRFFQELLDGDTSGPVVGGDAVGLLLLVRIVEHHQATMAARRRLRCLDGYMNKLLVMLWPKLNKVLAQQTKSLRTASAASKTTCAVLFGEGRRPWAQVLQPHVATRRYAEFSAALLVVRQGESLAKVLDELRSGFEGTLKTLSRYLLEHGAETGEGDPPTAVDRVFLINNLGLVLEVYQERGVPPPAMEAVAHMREEQIAAYVEAELALHFGSLHMFVHSSEADVERADAAEMERVGVQFTAQWQAAVRTLQGRIHQAFTNIPQAAEISKQALTQLLLYYTRYQKMVVRWAEAHGEPQPPWAAGLVSSGSILELIKRSQKAPYS